MTSVWRIATDTPGYTADDLTGAGAKSSGGRWNRPGNAMIYCASNISLAVLETFVRLYDDGLIYRGKRLVNWDPTLGTAVSDLEVDNDEEQDGNEDAA